MKLIIDFFDKLGLEMVRYTVDHIYLTFLAVLIAVVIAVPLGIYLTRTRWPRLASAVMGTAGIIQTIPTLALIAFIVLLFSLARYIHIHLATIGFVPGLVALVLYALLPILRNTYTGIRQVDPAIKEVATGMGMKPHQVLLRVELPLSLPVIMAGIRISTVWTIGIATLCGLIGAGGLGDLIFRGLRSLPRTMDYLIAGTLPAAALAIVFDWTLARVERWLTPTGLKSTSPSG
jgi:osmoprotectant transport system permease protein